MSNKAIALLKRIGRSADSSVPLRHMDAPGFAELKSLGFAVLIPISTGGADVCLTSAGVDEYLKRESNNGR